MDRTYYDFDKQPPHVTHQRPPNRMRFFICASPDCRKAVHFIPKKGERPKWCSAQCYVRERQRRIRQIPKSKHWPRKPRHKGVLGTQHWSLR